MSSSRPLMFFAAVAWSRGRCSALSGGNQGEIRLEPAMSRRNDVARLVAATAMGPPSSAIEGPLTPLTPPSSGSGNVVHVALVDVGRVAAQMVETPGKKPLARVDANT